MDSGVFLVLFFFFLNTIVLGLCLTFLRLGATILLTRFQVM